MATLNEQRREREMQRRLIYSLIPLLLLVANAAAQTKTAAVKQELETNYTKMAAALQAKDWQAVLTFIAQGYEQVSPNGEVTERGVLAADLEQTMEVMRTITASYRVISVLANKEEAIATIRYTFAGETEPDPQGVRHKITMTAPMRATWVKTDAGWRLKRNEELKGTVALLDGKPIKQQ
jgi:uncharacterized protein YcfL